ncbi:hypothetical protein GQF42_44615 [Streptomyces broussonetiae]|uniref:Competence protein CoiA nuclease-like domain-containing protein n=1 Tax=Streptomyces broussonetiae TaxID=2686304 RepID=A0A6I6NK00_9ACTN|nr:hypothetical protein [Streptomyces broussonetiae]QHA09315.1 hypothetical protein GQF42_44615 [Streptomyces broussonetiae]
MANGVFHTRYGIEINLTREDLDHPDHTGLLEEITQPVGQRPRDLLQCLTDYKGGQCQCALDGKTPWMFVRRQRRGGKVMWVAAHLPLTHVATPQESDKHKAMKERIARTASRHGLHVQTEARSEDGRVITDVLVTGAGARVGWEAQYSPITASTVRRRSAKARERNIAPLWVTADATSALIDRAPWTRVDDVPWQRIISPLALIIRGGVRHLQIWKCTPTSERSCPETGRACGKWHSGWFLPALCIPQERATPLDELIVTSADGEHLPVRSRNRHDPHRTSYLWALARDVKRWHEITGETNTPPETGPADDEPLTYTEQELDSSCHYGDETPHTSSPRPQRETTSATGLQTFDHAPDDTLLQPTRPIALHLSPRERLVIAAELKCPPWEIGPCMLCATPIHRYGPRSPKACPACRTTTQQT